MTNAELVAEARKLDAEATKGPWEVVTISDGWNGKTLAIKRKNDALKEPYVCSGWGSFACGLDIEPVNAAFIARARTLLPKLADALEKAEAVLRPMLGLRYADSCIGEDCAEEWIDAAHHYFGEVKDA